MLRTTGRKRSKKVFLANRWYIRRLMGIGNSVSVTLPAPQIRWNRARSGYPFKWQAGDSVRVGLTPSGRFVVEWMGEIDSEHGPVLGVDEEIEQQAERYIEDEQDGEA